MEKKAAKSIIQAFRFFKKKKDLFIMLMDKDP